MKPRLTRSLQRLTAVVVVCATTLAQADDLTWNGQADTPIWNTQATNSNWLSSGTPAPFATGDNVTFATPIGTEVTTVQVGEDLQAGTMTVNDAYTINTTAESNINAVIGGTGTLTKSGEYLLTLQAADGTTEGPALAVAEGNLALSGTATYRELSSMSDGTALQISEGADITFANAATGTDVALQGTLRLNEGDSTLRAIIGSGTLSLADAATLALAADSMFGSLDSAGTVNAAGNLFIMQHVENGGEVNATRLILANGGNFTTLRTDNLVIGSEINRSTAAVTTQTLGALSGTDMQVDVARTVRGSGDYLLVQAEQLGESTYTLSQDTIARYRKAGYLTDMNSTAAGLVLTLDSFNNGFYTRHAFSPNGRAGAALLDQAFADLDPQAYRAAHPDLARVLDAMEAYLVRGNTRSADALAANVAGAGLGNLNSAWRSQMERQLRTIRNRVATMQGGMPCYAPDPKAPHHTPRPYTLWANAEMDYQNQRSENTLPGYKLNSIGGTAGFAMLAAHELTVGAAFTGMAGRLSSKGYGTNASGDLDAYYANIFMRMDTGCWQHSLIGTAGWADITFKRRIHFPGGSYATRGSTDGMGLGFMYEIARSYKISEDWLKSAWWQPVLNLAYVHSEVDGYTETGSDAALRVGKQSSNNVIFGFGARMQGIVGEQWLNTPATMEARLLGKATTGARRGKAHVSIPGVAGTSTVRGSEPSAMGIELGMGFNIPLGMNSGAIITDVTAEFYQDQTSVNGMLGYRIDF